MDESIHDGMKAKVQEGIHVGVGLPTRQQVQSERKRQKRRRTFMKELRTTLYVLIVVAAIAVLVATLFLPVLQIEGTSMEPTLKSGNIVLSYKTNKLKRGDICAFTWNNKVLMKRVIGLPGDRIEIAQDGTVSVNGKKIDEPYISQKSLGECDIKFPYTVPQEQYFLMGDKRDTSIDSRSTVLGCVKKDQIIGKVFIKVWPFKNMLLS